MHTLPISAGLLASEGLAGAFSVLLAVASIGPFKELPSVTRVLNIADKTRDTSTLLGYGCNDSGFVIVVGSRYFFNLVVVV